ncbi:MAG: signal peptidase I [Anaerohalosphaeraceae bacterium]|nr:signal peptidase I [Anaerohalosphaeraceae bacterium]
MSAEKKHAKKRHSTAESVANTFEWLITAFVLAFVFRAFVLEAFRIPTGSMADTLMGDHFRIRCSQCGYEYEFNFDPEAPRKFGTATSDGKFRLLPNPRCSSCGYYENTNTVVPKSNGDRILVFKGLYQFTDPKRWDVVVFKNPTNPTENYIKRLIARPGETLEIIDGDIYIDGQIARKPAKVQQEMWMPIYVNDYQPVRPNEVRFNGHGWKLPFSNDSNSKWTFNKAKSTVFTLDSPSGETNIMYYDVQKGNNFQASYAYGSPMHYRNLPICSDLMMEFYATSDGNDCVIGIGLQKYGTLYKAAIGRAGMMTIEKLASDGTTTELAKTQSDLTIGQTPVQVKFANVDHRLIFEVANEKLIYDLGPDKNDAGTILPQSNPDAIVFGSGKLSLSHLALYRDIHYLNIRQDNKRPVLRAGQGDPFTLGDDEFFVLGDNSPDSADSRLWPVEGLGNNGKRYRAGTVPRDYLVGKAFFVYWPSGFTAGKTKLAFIPNVEKMRFIYGGTN